jgi:diaminohydroxyphosphoribosylaminopyrimidine deaminase / 5-amino-6-(5-phosphoribosylamino)uracil reductase
LRVVLDARGETPREARVLQGAAPTRLYHGEGATPPRGKDVKTLALPLDASGRLPVPGVLEDLAVAGVRSVLVEGGGETVGRFVGRGLANKLTLFYAPKVLGSEGIPLMGSLKITGMNVRTKFDVESVEKVGEDIAVTLYPSAEVERVYRAG